MKLLTIIAFAICLSSYTYAGCGACGGHDHSHDHSHDDSAVCDKASKNSCCSKDGKKCCKKKSCSSENKSACSR